MCSDGKRQTRAVCFLPCVEKEKKGAQNLEPGHGTTIGNRVDCGSARISSIGILLRRSWIPVTSRLGGGSGFVPQRHVCQVLLFGRELSRDLYSAGGITALRQCSGLKWHVENPGRRRT